MKFIKRQFIGFLAISFGFGQLVVYSVMIEELNFTFGLFMLANLFFILMVITAIMFVKGDEVVDEDY